MSEHAEVMDHMDLDGELYLSICDLRGVEVALSGDDAEMDKDAMYGLWRTVRRSTDRLQAIKEDLPTSATR